MEKKSGLGRCDEASGLLSLIHDLNHVLFLETMHKL